MTLTHIPLGGFDRARWSTMTKGAAIKIAGATKDAVGKATNDPKLQAKGKAQKANSAVQDARGSVNDALGQQVQTTDFRPGQRVEFHWERGPFSGHSRQKGTKCRRTETTRVQASQKERTPRFWQKLTDLRKKPRITTRVDRTRTQKNQRMNESMWWLLLVLGLTR